MLDYSDMPKVSTGNRCIPRIVNRQDNRANPLAVSLRQFFRSSVFLPFIDTVLKQLCERFRSDLVDCIKLQFLISFF